MWNVTPTTWTPSSLAASSRCRQLFKEKPNDMLVSAAWAWVVSCSSNLGEIKTKTKKTSASYQNIKEGFPNFIFIFNPKTKLMYFLFTDVENGLLFNLTSYFALGCRREILDNSASLSHTRCWMLFLAACLMCASCLQTPDRMMFSGSTPCSSTRLTSAWRKDDIHV